MSATDRHDLSSLIHTLTGMVDDVCGIIFRFIAPDSIYFLGGEHSPTVQACDTTTLITSPVRPPVVCTTSYRIKSALSSDRKTLFVLTDSNLKLLRRGREKLKFDRGLTFCGLHRRCDFEMVAIEDHLFVIGGTTVRGRRRGGHPTGVCYRGNLGSDAHVHWKRIRDMPTPRRSFGACSLNGKVYVAGGKILSRLNIFHDLDALEAYDLATKTWSFISWMNYKRSGCAMVAACGMLFVIGGREREFPRADRKSFMSHQDNSMEAFCLESLRWTNKSPCPELFKPGSINACASGSHIYVTNKETHDKKLFRYSVLDDAWEILTLSDSYPRFSDMVVFPSKLNQE